ncbi:MAG: formylglycine-generating enzyme family protein [Spirochaetia bacterium]|nr:formylglycine-generating enzyme family protein [Spirochaetia bacterium]
MKRTTEFIHTLIFIFLALIPAVSCKNELWPVKDSDSDSSVKTVSTANRTITIPDADSTASFVMIDVNIEGGIDEIILGEDLIEVPYRTTVSSFSLARYETSYNTWYEVLQWAKENGYTIVNEGVEGLYGTDAEHQSNMSDPGSKPNLVEMPVCGLTWRDVMVWCNALSEMCGLTPVYCTDSNFKTPIRNSTGTKFGDLKNYALTPGEVDNPYVNKGANGFRLPYVEEWEYAARKKKDGGFISGRNVSGDEAGSAVDMTPTETMNGINFPKSTRQNEYCWQYGNSDWNGPSTTATGKNDTNAKLSELTGKSISGKRMHLSGGRRPNHLGFYDMSGNVPEWCFDYNTPYGSTYKFHTQRSYRGGDHANDIVGSRCSGHTGGQLVALTGGFRIAQNKPM